MPLRFHDKCNYFIYVGLILLEVEMWVLDQVEVLQEEVLEEEVLQQLLPAVQVDQEMNCRIPNRKWMR